MMTLPISMIEYFTRFRDDILQCAKLTCFEDITVKHILSFMGKKGYKNGIGAMSAEERKAANEKGYENGIGAMSAEERKAANEKGYENGIGAMSAEERMAVDEKIAAANAAKRDAKWTEEVDATIERLIEDGVSYAKIASKLGNAANAAKRDAKWTEEVDATIERLIEDGVSYAKIASKLGNGLSKNDITHRWHDHLKKSSSIIKPAVQCGFSSRINWTEEVDASIVRMREDGISFAKIALELGNGLSKNDIAHRWNRHLKVKLQ
jgi:ribosome modulation factor